ncbi:hypothetical protein BOX37_23780 [Nocardia mangyaensis]|uniref:Ava_C0101 and related proteins n=1 Tax=Nocardia mangyaensis TaxID=2213200 RepID=A0A1J0VWK2_9NOCA|nr:DUF5996 family protein [Nocardia mangyaensis]APE36448.1 hypothetical protein BOX37_23780 [Nocardia mangyaensis]
MTRLTPAKAIWPALTVDSWTDTRDTLHMWTQIVGKLKMAGTPLVNHWWNVTFAVSARGLSTGAIPVDGRLLDIEFDFVDHELVLRTSDGRRATVALRPRTVADFYAAVGETLGRLDIVLDIEATPNEVETAIPFARDTTHHSYDAQAAAQFWQQLVQINRVFQLWRAGFAGKSSPVHVFWGAFDLACTRFSGRTAPPHPGGAPNCANWVMEEGYSRECASAGFWPGGAEGTFYAYSYPAPEGYSEHPVTPESAHWDADLGEFVLPYEVVRAADDPDATLLEFLQSTYAAAADLAHWDRKLLDVDPHRLDRRLDADDHTRL